MNSLLEKDGKWKVSSEEDNTTGENLPVILSIQEVSHMLHVHVNTLRRWSNMGVLPVYRIGPRGDRRFRREDIDTFLTNFDRQ